MNNKKYKGILFDFDGVLAETMECHYNAWKAVMQEYGVKIRSNDYYPLEGKKMEDTAKILLEKYGKKTTPELCKEIRQKKIAYFLKNNRFRFYPGVQTFIKSLHKKVKLGIVTASSIEQLTNTVGREFLDYFDTVITVDDTTKNKPEPDPYLKGAEKLNLQPEECIAIENAPLGIESAKKAGCFCIAITSTVEKDKLKEADIIVESFEDLKNNILINSILNN